MTAALSTVEEVVVPEDMAEAAGLTKNTFVARLNLPYTSICSGND